MLLSTLLQESPDGACLHPIDAFCNKTNPIRSIRFTCDDTILELTGSATVVLYRLRDIIKARTRQLVRVRDEFLDYTKHLVWLHIICAVFK